MESSTPKTPEVEKTPVTPSPVKTVISWLVEADREFRVAQSMVDETHKKL